MIRKTCEKIQKHFYHSNISKNLITNKKQMQWVKSWQDQISKLEKKAEQQAMKHDWKKWWAVNSSIWKLVDVKSSSCSVFKLHQDLHKAESSFITQIHFDCINFMIFLNKMNVFDYKSLTCQCSQTWETVTHVIIYCFRFAEIRHILKNSITN